MDEVANMRPGVVYASLSAYGWSGPWSNRRGVSSCRHLILCHCSQKSQQCVAQFDSLTQTATGINKAEAEAFNSQTTDRTKHVDLKPLPLQALDDAAGQLLALGVSAALARTYIVRHFVSDELCLDVR